MRKLRNWERYVLFPKAKNKPIEGEIPIKITQKEVKDHKVWSEPLDFIRTSVVPSRDFVRYSFAICLVFLCLFSAYSLPFLCLLFGVSLLILCLYTNGSAKSGPILTAGISQLRGKQLRFSTLPGTYQVRPASDRHGFSAASRRLRSPMAIGARSDNDQSAKPEMQNKGGRKGEVRHNLVRTKRTKNAINLPSIYQKATVSIRVTYQKYTLDLLKSYQILTKKLPTRYQKGSKKLVSPYREATGKVQAFSSSMVLSPWRVRMLLSRGSVICSVMILFFICVLLSDAQAQSAGERAAEGLTITGKARSKFTNVPLESATIQLLNAGSPNVFADQNGSFSMPIKEGEGCLKISLAGYKDTIVSFDEGVLFPEIVYLAPDIRGIAVLRVGDTILDALWSLPLRVFNHPEGRSLITLNEYRNKELMILEFWAKWCSPCVRSFKALEVTVDSIGSDRVGLLGVNVGIFEKSAAFAKNAGIRSPNVYGDEFYVLNAYFFDFYQAGHSVMIKEGRVWAIEPQKQHTADELKDIMKTGNRRTAR